MANSVTAQQALALHKLGYRGKCNDYVVNRNARGNYVNIPVPSVDQAIDWIRIKYDVVIYNKIEPYVDPVLSANKKKSQILYEFGVKYCDTTNGWNFRQYVGKSNITPNIYSAKREAITLALKYIERYSLKKR